MSCAVHTQKLQYHIVGNSVLFRICNILECTEYLCHNLMCSVIQVIILVALVVYNH